MKQWIQHHLSFPVKSKKTSKKEGDYLIEITGLKLDGHSVQVPVGLSELTSKCWVKKKETIGNTDYDRKVINREGQFVTILKKR